LEHKWVADFVIGLATAVCFVVCTLEPPSFCKRRTWGAVRTSRQLFTVPATSASASISLLKYPLILISITTTWLHSYLPPPPSQSQPLRPLAHTPPQQSTAWASPTRPRLPDQAPASSSSGCSWTVAGYAPLLRISMARCYCKGSREVHEYEGGLWRRERYVCGGVAIVEEAWFEEVRR
jgi:hypothetical protein